MKKRGKGMALENMIEEANKLYKVQGGARVHPTYPHVTIHSRGAGGRITGRLSGKGAVDYWGVLKGGRAVCFDAKELKSGCLPISRIKEHQRDDIATCHNMGGISGVILLYERSRIYWIPAETIIQADMRATRGGRKSIPADEIQQCPEILPTLNTCRCDWMPVVMRLEDEKRVEESQLKLF